MEQIHPVELKAWLDDPERLQPLLLDVREPWEFELCHLPGARLIPMQSLPAHLAELDPERETVVICHHGVRSFHAGRLLEHNGFRKIINLSGGVDYWAKQIDHAMPTY